MRFVNAVMQGFAALGMFAVAMFALGYLYASIPLVKAKSCTPTITDRIFK